ncbi:MAG: hypothetical protein HYT16_03400 [DPANN group archaeon]|nr:hypothetical protein [DPANN group archaeon]
MVKSGKGEKIADVHLRSLQLRRHEELLVLGALFEKPMGIGSLTNSISAKVDGPDLSVGNLEKILARLERRKAVLAVQVDEGKYWYLTPATYNRYLQVELDGLQQRKVDYGWRVDELLQRNTAVGF